MAIFGVYIINRAGGLIYQYDHNMPKVEVEKTFSYPLELTLKIYDEKVVVAFGQRDGIKGKNVYFIILNTYKFAFIIITCSICIVLLRYSWSHCDVSKWYQCNWANSGKRP